MPTQERDIVNAINDLLDVLEESAQDDMEAAIVDRLRRRIGFVKNTMSIGKLIIEQSDILADVGVHVKQTHIEFVQYCMNIEVPENIESQTPAEYGFLLPFVYNFKDRMKTLSEEEIITMFVKIKNLVVTCARYINENTE